MCGFPAIHIRPRWGRVAFVYHFGLYICDPFGVGGRVELSGILIGQEIFSARTVSIHPDDLGKQFDNSSGWRIPDGAEYFLHVPYRFIPMIRAEIR
jgi:hypothetical protein